MGSHVTMQSVVTHACCSQSRNPIGNLHHCYRRHLSRLHLGDESVIRHAHHCFGTSLVALASFSGATAIACNLSHFSAITLKFPLSVFSTLQALALQLPSTPATQNQNQNQNQNQSVSFSVITLHSVCQVQDRENELRRTNGTRTRT